MIKLSNGITERTIHWMCVNLPLEPTVDYIYHVGLMCCWVPWQKAADMVTPSPLRTGAGISKEYTAFPVGLPIIMASKEINCNSVIAPSLLPLTGPQKYFFSVSQALSCLGAFAPALASPRKLSRFHSASSASAQRSTQMPLPPRLFPACFT